VDIAAGVIALLFPGLAAVVRVFVIAIWAILTGLLNLVDWRLRDYLWHPDDHPDSTRRAVGDARKRANLPKLRIIDRLSHGSTG